MIIEYLEMSLIIEIFSILTLRLDPDPITNKNRMDRINLPSPIKYKGKAGVVLLFGTDYNSR